jgi:hypothetical protein
MVPSRYASPPQAARLAGGDRDGPGRNQTARSTLLSSRTCEGHDVAKYVYRLSVDTIRWFR